MAEANPERLARFAAEFGCAGYSSLGEMLANPASR
jgi:predicted dehydrogenase